jgi:hypothetical protein
MYQVRFNNSSLEFFDTFEDAFDACQRSGGWKISFNGNRWVKWETTDEFDEYFEEIDKTLISENFLEKQCPYLWINQPLRPQIKHDEKDKILITYKVLEILTNGQLQSRYNPEFLCG